MGTCPIYHAVSEEMGIFPLAMKKRNHAQFMRDHRQELWLSTVFFRVYGER